MTRFTIWVRDRLKYLTEDIWRIPLGDLPRRKSFVIREIRIIMLAFRGFTEDKIQLRASALTYNTLLSIVPVAALAFGIAQGFGFDKKLENEIMTNFQGQQEVMQWVLNLARNFLSNTSGGILAIIGLVILFWSVMQVLSHIEKSFNHIWQIRKSRPWIRKFSDYLSIMIFGPVLLLAAGTITVYLSTKVETLSGDTGVLGTIKPLLLVLIKVLPYIMMWAAFTLLYIVIPNTRVKFRSAVVAGIIAGSLFQLLNWAYITFQIGVSKYNALYGTFAAFPLFIIWMQLSWLVVLFGAEISFANQNVNKYEYESTSLNISIYQRKIVTLMLLNIIVRRFRDGEAPVSASELSKMIQIPIRIGREILYELGLSGLVTEITVDQTRERLYQPSMDTSKYRIGHILTVIEKSGSDSAPVVNSREHEKITGMMLEFEKLIDSADSNILVSDI